MVNAALVFNDAGKIERGIEEIVGHEAELLTALRGGKTVLLIRSCACDCHGPWGVRR